MCIEESGEEGGSALATMHQLTHLGHISTQPLQLSVLSSKPSPPIILCTSQLHTAQKADPQCTSTLHNTAIQQHTLALGHALEQ